MAGKLYHDSGDTDDSVAITIAAVSDVKHTVNHISCSLDVAPTDVANTRLQVESPSGTTIFRLGITVAGPAPIHLPSDGIVGAEGEAMIISLIGTEALTGYLNVIQVS